MNATRNVSQSPGNKLVAQHNVDINGDAKAIKKDLKADPSQSAADKYNKDMQKMIGDVQTKAGDAGQKLGMDEKHSINSVQKALHHAGQKHPDLDKALQQDGQNLTQATHGQMPAHPNGELPNKGDQQQQGLRQQPQTSSC